VLGLLKKDKKVREKPLFSDFASGDLEEKSLSGTLWEAT
jgi:hypothetical protein